MASVLVNCPAFLKGDAVKSNAQFPVLAPPRRRKGISRPSILDHVKLSDGRLAWPAAKAAGVHEATFRARLKAGVSPDEAVKPVAPRPRLSDGRVAWPVAKAAGVSKLTYHARIRRGLDPDRAVRPVPSRPRLSDGRLAWPVAKAAGVSSATFWYRLRKAGWSPDEAVKPVARRSSARPPQA